MAALILIVLFVITSACVLCGIAENDRNKRYRWYITGVFVASVGGYVWWWWFMRVPPPASPYTEVWL